MNALLMLAETTSTDVTESDFRLLEQLTAGERAELIAEEERDRRLDYTMYRACGEEVPCSPHVSMVLVAGCTASFSSFARY